MRPTSALLVLCLISAPAFAATHTELAAAGRAAMERGEAEKAAELYQKAIKLSPKNAEYHYYLGAAYGEMAMAASMFGKASLAKKLETEFETAVKLDPNLIEARMGLVDYYTIAPGFMGGDSAKALEQAAEIKKRDNIEGHRAFARIHARGKKLDLARREFADAVRENPTSPKAHYLLATFYVNEKNWTAGLQEIEAALKLDPGYMPAHYRLGALAAQSGQNYSRGEEGLRRYLAYRPGKNEPSLAYAWYFLGMIQEKQGKKSEAKASYATAKKLAPNAKDIAEAFKRVS